MKTLVNILIAATLCAFVASPVTVRAEKPHGLMTDMVEHTDRTWHNGYKSNVAVWQADGAIEALQYVEIASDRPSFGWIVPGEKTDTRQTAFRIVVADNHRDAAEGKGNVWDSGEVESSASTAVIYGGQALQPSKNYFWRVRTTTTTDGESDWSDVKAFRTAARLSPYAATHYPQIKTLEHPVSAGRVGDGVTFVDFGKDAFGQLLVTLTSEGDRDSVVIHLGEHAIDGRIERRPGGTIRYQRHSVALDRGTHTYRINIHADRRNTRGAAVLMPDYIGEVLPFRYVEIERYDKPVAATDIVRESVHYPFDDRAASFSSSDDILNQVWELCKYSIRATSFIGIYVDGDRERIPYEADALINQLSHYGVDREYSMARRSHEYLLKYPTWPTEWILQAVLIAWNDYIYTGDSRSLKANYDILKTRSLTALREKNGMISTSTGLLTPEFKSANNFKADMRDIVDWPHTGILGLNKLEGGEADGFVFTDYNAVINAYHYETLRLMALIAAAVDRPSEADYYTSEAAKFVKRFNEVFFDKKSGHYVDGPDAGHASLHSNMFPMAFGMVPGNRIPTVTEFIHSRGMACSVYGSQFLMDALYGAGDAEYALSMLTKTDDRGWYNMIRVGSTISLEAWDNKYKPNQDWNHAWGAAPANVIPRKLMGVEPLTPGFGRARIKPQLGSLAWARATIPTIKGGIHMEVDNAPGVYTMRLNIPANMTGEVYLPLPDAKYEITVDGVALKAARVKGEPFVCLGDLPSGSHDVVMRYSK